MALEQLSSGLFATQRHFSPVVALKQLSLGFIWAVIRYTETLQSCVAPEQLSLGFMNHSLLHRDILVLCGPRTIKFRVRDFLQNVQRCCISNIKRERMRSW